MKYNEMKSILGFAILIGGLSLLTGCENVDDRTARNTGIGATTGAIVGGVVGHQSGETAEGAAVGAALGGAGGYGYSKATEDENDQD